MEKTKMKAKEKDKKSAEDIKKSLGRVKSISKGVYYLFNTLFYLCCVMNVFIIGLSIFALFSPETLEINTTAGLEGIIGSLFLMIPIAVILKLIAWIFRDITKEESPFTLKQTKRLRWIALFILLDVVVNAIFSTGLFGVSSGVFGTFGMVSSDYTNHVSINLFQVFFALVIFCLSFAFEYGFLLQEDCNDTV